MKNKTHERWCSKHQRVHKEGTQYKSCRFPNNEPKFIPVNVYKPGTKAYYRDVLELIAITGEIENENINNEIVDSLVRMALDALNHKKMYFELEEK